MGQAAWILAGGRVNLRHTESSPSTLLLKTGAGYILVRRHASRRASQLWSDLRLFGDEAGQKGVEYQTGVGRIDVLAVDDAGNFYVFELKLDRSADEAMGHRTLWAIVEVMTDREDPMNQSDFKDWLEDALVGNGYGIATVRKVTSRREEALKEKVRQYHRRARKAKAKRARRN